MCHVVVTDRRPPSNNTQRHDRARAAGEIARHRLAAKREQLRRDHAATKLQARVRCAQGGRRAAERLERNEQDAGARALLHRLGVAQVESLPALMETLKLLHLAGPLSSNRVVSLSCSGGEASLMADSAIRHDICFPPLDAGQADALRAALGPMVALPTPWITTRLSGIMWPR